MDRPKKATRYQYGYVFYKSVTCKMTELDINIIDNFCRSNNISRSLFLNCAAMYCINNNVGADVLLKQTFNNSTDDCKEMIKDEKNI